MGINNVLIGFKTHSKYQPIHGITKISKNLILYWDMSLKKENCYYKSVK